MQLHIIITKENTVLMHVSTMQFYTPENLISVCFETLTLDT